MVKIQTKRIYDAYFPDDGFRVLVDRLWPRGISKENAHLDLWEKELAPSTELREWFHSDPDNRWSNFVARYKSELDHSEWIDSFVKTIESKCVVTLLYASKESELNNAVVLGEYLAKYFK